MELYTTGQDITEPKPTISDSNDRTTGCREPGDTFKGCVKLMFSNKLLNEDRHSKGEICCTLLHAM